MRAISRRFRRMNEVKLQISNDWSIESTSILFTRTWRIDHEAWEKDDCEITSWRTSKRDEDTLNRRRDKEMHVYWAFHIQSHWTSSWDRIWPQTEGLFMASSKATTVNSISILRNFWNIAKSLSSSISSIRKSLHSSIRKSSISFFEILSITWIFISIQQIVVQSIIFHFIIQTITHLITHIIPFTLAKLTRKTAS